MLRSILLWLPMVLIAFANATLRELVLLKYFDELRAHQWSTVTLILFCAIYTWFIVPYLQLRNNRQAILVGGLWVLLTVLFEFALGLALKHTWNEMLLNYRVGEGGLWPLFLGCLWWMPWAAKQLRVES